MKDCLNSPNLRNRILTLLLRDSDCTIYANILWEVITAVTKIYNNENGQLLGIPSEMQTEFREYIIKKIGEVYIAYPVDDPWAPLKQVVGTFDDEYMLERDQPDWE